jgi:cell division septum initiation protein DivIVA
MNKVRAATQKADKVVVAKVTQLKEENQELKTQNEELKEEVKVLEVAVAATNAPAVPFDILAILPDSTN